MSVRAAFQKYLSPALVEALASDSLGKLERDLKPARISFVIFQVRDQPPENVPSYFEAAFPIVVDHDGFIEEIFSSIVMAGFAGFPWQESSLDRRSEAVTALLAKLGSNIRIVHGCAQGLVGNIGTSTRFSFGALLPGLARYLETLARLEFGQVTEVTPAAP